MTYKIKYQKIVDKVRMMWTVDGKKFIKDKSFSDERIDKQVRLVMDLKPVSENRWDILIQEAVATHELKPELFNPKITEQIMRNVLGFKYVVDQQFWANSASVAYKQKYFRFDSNKIPRTALGLHDVFGEDNWEQYSNFQNHPQKFRKVVESILRTKKDSAKLKSQREYMFDNAAEYLNAIEKVQEVIIDDARKFYKDPKKPLDQRLTLFNKFGADENCIHSPNDKYLELIFQLYAEDGYIIKRESIECSSIVNWWIGELEYYRLSLDNSNSCHPKLMTKTRNYTPSPIALAKIKERHMNVLISEGVSKFDFDW